MTSTDVHPSVHLDHQIILAKDADRSARFLTKLLGLPKAVPSSIFLAVELADGVTLLYKEVRHDFPGQHYAFRVSNGYFEKVLARVQAQGIEYWGKPRRRDPGQVYRLDGNRGFYLLDPAGHGLEILTAE